MKRLFLLHKVYYPSYSTCWLALIFLFLSLGCTEQQQEVGLKHGERHAAVQDFLPLATLMSSPGDYVGKEVAVKGTVASSLAFEFVSEQPYLLEDAGQKLWVITDGMVPPKGEQVTVSGVVTAPYQIKGRHYDLVLVVDGGAP